MSDSSLSSNNSTVFAVRMGLFPPLFYFVVFCLFTYPLILSFSTHYFADQGDGLQNIWNLWWVNKAVTQLQQLPWWTSYLHYPYGISLLGHTLNPFNGFFGILLLRFLTLVETHNFIVIFSFVMGGYTAFLLSYSLAKSYSGSLIAGFIFTFSNYHFAHAEGHLQLVSLEWIPLFVLLWYLLVTKPSVIVALASGLVLLLVVLCDYYYFLYCVVIGGFLVGWQAIRQKDYLFLFRGDYLFPALVFVFVVLATAGPLIISLLLLNTRDPLVGFHQPKEFSLDLFAPLIPGGHWRFSSLTHFYWSALPGNIHESSVHMGLAVLFVLVYVWIRRREAESASLRLWYFTLVLFAVMSFGPVLHIWGREVPYVRLPYALLEKVFPPLKLSGVPVRMMVMVVLCASVICAMGFKMLFQGAATKRLLAAGLVAMLFLEYLPKPIPSSQMPTIEYVNVLKNLPGNEGVVDLVAPPAWALYYQTIHDKPMAFGYVARVPRSVHEKEHELRQTLQRKEYLKLCHDYNIRYLIMHEERSDSPLSFKVLYRDDTITLYDLMAESRCVKTAKDLVNDSQLSNGV